ncbi:phosphatidylinositol-glycan biosynthesis class X protein-like isoform X1 [Triticum dicoccoides]|uniref:phosphatidylinositol-glycan biosynthesis class X protein-like isoform X1 n=2 Tax=Triticum dicoccoides TaxID=85692 RepID=UPI000E78CDC7|nr:phosphatidylinositol-glycan biosynthesis class X protein-like isoform X1 [Triticum dicoccoides]
MFLGLLNPHAPHGKLLAVGLVAAWTSIAAAASSLSEQVWCSQKSFNCMPCSMIYISDAYPGTFTPPLAQHNGLADVPDSSDLCKGLTNDLDVPVLLESHRQLVGEGSHRRLVYSMKFGNSEDTLVKFLDDYDANLVIIESLPSGVFVDPFELHHFVERKVFLDVAVFGDTNLELPSALSNLSAVEIHFDLKPSTSMNCNLVMELPLHARYPSLDASGYATVEFGSPDLLLHYRRKETHPNSCLCVLQNLDAMPVEKATWRIPCGNEAHTGFVSSLTFISALVCSMSIVLAASLVS